MIDPDYDEKIALWETLEDLKEIQKKVDLLMKKIKKFILSENPEEDNIDDVDPREVIKKYGADAFRSYAASCALGVDNPFRTKDVVRGVKLLRKIWNVQQFIANVIKDERPKKVELIDIDKWILTKYSKLIKKCS